jgi:hypothetical protein
MKNLGRDWLKENDPCYISPAKKAVETKRTSWSVESALTFIGGDGCSKAGKNGKRIPLTNTINFTGSEEGGWGIEPSVSYDLDNAIDQSKAPKRRRGKRAGKKHQ